ncbi:MAG: hypothetical protein KOO63_07950 [Bacteroidales bacterium]|nr:hypothetical protein [Candidatus Latescibacterota bacterium]
MFWEELKWAREDLAKEPLKVKVAIAILGVFVVTGIGAIVLGSFQSMGFMALWMWLGLSTFMWAVITLAANND